MDKFGSLPTKNINMFRFLAGDKNYCLFL